MKHRTVPANPPLQFGSVVRVPLKLNLLSVDYADLMTLVIFFKAHGGRIGVRLLKSRSVRYFPKTVEERLD